MRKTIRVALFLILPLLLLGVTGVSQAQLVLYDDFSAAVIDPAKWFGVEGTIGPASPNTEEMRTISGGQLELAHTMYGRTDSNTGVVGNASSNVQITNPAAVTTLQVDMTVESVTAVGCSLNPSATRAKTGMEGSFFNDGTSPAAGNRIGDILAGIQKTRDTNLGDLIEAFIVRCTNANCSTNSGSGTAFTAGWAIGVADTVGIQWDKPNKRFIFTLNPGGLSPETKILSYIVSDTAAPVSPFRGLYTSSAIANCQSGPRTSAKLQSLFDNVMVNP